jgi:hypothetical protein
VQKEEAEYSTGSDDADDHGSGAEADRAGESASDDYHAARDGSGDEWNRDDDDSSSNDEAKTET